MISEVKSTRLKFKKISVQNSSVVTSHWDLNIVPVEEPHENSEGQSALRAEESEANIEKTDGDGKSMKQELPQGSPVAPSFLHNAVPGDENQGIDARTTGHDSSTDIDISSLKSPQINDPSQVSMEVLQERLAFLSLLQYHMITELTGTQDVKTMISSANISFTLMDTLCSDYTSFYNDVKSYISFHIDRVKAEAMKTNPAFRLKNEYEVLEVAKKNAIEKKMESGHERSIANDKVAVCKAKEEALEEELRKVREERDGWEKKLAASDAEHAEYSEVLSLLEADMETIGPEMLEAVSIIEDVEKRLEKANDGIRETRDKLFSYFN